MIKHYCFTFLSFLLLLTLRVQAQEFLTDVEPIENEFLKNALRGPVDSCEYTGEGFWNECKQHVRDEVIFGSFSQVSVQEVYLATGRDCGNCFFGNLLRKESDQWKLLQRNVGYYGDACLKFTTLEQRDLLTCYVNERAEMDPSVEIWALDFSKPEPKIQLLYFEHPWINGSLCEQVFRGEKASVTYYKPINWMRTDFDADGDMDLYFILDTVEITQENCGDESTDDTTILATLPRSRKHLIWLLDGETFTPTLETQVFLENLQTQ